MIKKAADVRVGDTIRAPFYGVTIEGKVDSIRATTYIANRLSISLAHSVVTYVQADEDVEVIESAFSIEDHDPDSRSPLFDMAVTLRQIVPGFQYVTVHTGQGRVEVGETVYTVTTEPRFDAGESSSSLIFETGPHYDWQTGPQKVYAADRGITRYVGGDWNNVNFSVPYTVTALSRLARQIGRAEIPTKTPAPSPHYYKNIFWA